LVPSTTTFRAVGSDVAVDGDHAAIGGRETYFDNGQTHSREAVYLFHRQANQWSYVGVVKTPGARGNAGTFGSALALSGDTLVVGEPQGGSTGEYVYGATHIYRYVGSAWTYETTLTPSQGAIGLQYGETVAAFGNRVVVGSPAHWWYTGKIGRAFVYVHNGSAWTEEAVLIAQTTKDGFAQALTLQQETLVIGAPGADRGCHADAGAAYVFKKQGTQWQEQQMLTANDGEAGDGFGTAVGLYESTLVVGAPGEDLDGENSGAAYRFALKDNTFALAERLKSNNPGTEAAFGRIVSADKNRFAVGSFSLVANTFYGRGEIYLFSHSGERLAHQRGPEGQSAGYSDNFARTFAMSDDVLMVGASSRAPNFSGAVFVYDASLRTEVTFPVKQPSVVISNYPAHAEQTTFQKPPRPICESSICEQQRITPPDPIAGEHFGNSIALSGSLLAISSSVRLHEGFVGRLWIYRFLSGQWQHEADLVPTYDLPGQNYVIGLYDLAADGATVAVPVREKVYIFVRDQGKWKQQATLIHRAEVMRLSLKGDVLTTGTVGHPDRGAWAGAVHVFRRNTDAWALDATLQGEQTEAGDRFGAWFVHHDNKLIVGAPQEDTVCPNFGAIYTFEKSPAGWQQTAHNLPSTTAGWNWFRGRLVLHGDSALVAGDDAAVHAVAVQDWHDQQALKPSDPTRYPQYGRTLAVMGDQLLVGSEEGKGEGALHTFQWANGSWNYQETLKGSSPGTYRHFAWSLSTDGGQVAVGSARGSVDG